MTDPTYHDTKGRFAPGNPGGGRPKGARSKLVEDFVSDLQDEWKAGGKDALKKVREEKPDVFVQVVAKLVPKDIRFQAEASEAFIEALRMIQDMQPKPAAIEHPRNPADLKLDDAGVYSPIDTEAIR